MILADSLSGRWAAPAAALALAALLAIATVEAAAGSNPPSLFKTPLTRLRSSSQSSLGSQKASETADATAECLGMDGRPVDWWIMYKRPGSGEYVYLDANKTLESCVKSSFSHGLSEAHTINDIRTSPFLRTIYGAREENPKEEREHNRSDSKVTIAWNDQHPEKVMTIKGGVASRKRLDAYGSGANTDCAHSKGILGISVPPTAQTGQATASAFLITHSFPRIPETLDYNDDGLVVQSRYFPCNSSHVFSSSTTGPKSMAQHAVCLSMTQTVNIVEGQIVYHRRHSASEAGASSESGSQRGNLFTILDGLNLIQPSITLSNYVPWVKRFKVFHQLFNSRKVWSDLPESYPPEAPQSIERLEADCFVSKSHPEHAFPLWAGVNEKGRVSWYQSQPRNMVPHCSIEEPPTAFPGSLPLAYPSQPRCFEAGILQTTARYHQVEVHVDFKNGFAIANTDDIIASRIKGLTLEAGQGPRAATRDSALLDTSLPLKTVREEAVVVDDDDDNDDNDADDETARKRRSKHRSIADNQKESSDEEEDEPPRRRANNKPKEKAFNASLEEGRAARQEPQHGLEAKTHQDSPFRMNRCAVKFPPNSGSTCSGREGSSLWHMSGFDWRSSETKSCLMPPSSSYQGLYDHHTMEDPFARLAREDSLRSCDEQSALRDAFKGSMGAQLLPSSSKASNSGDLGEAPDWGSPIAGGRKKGNPTIYPQDCSGDMSFEVEFDEGNSMSDSPHSIYDAIIVPDVEAIEQQEAGLQERQVPLPLEQEAALPRGYRIDMTPQKIRGRAEVRKSDDHYMSITIATQSWSNHSTLGPNRRCLGSNHGYFTNAWFYNVSEVSLPIQGTSPAAKQEYMTYLTSGRDHSKWFASYPHNNAGPFPAIAGVMDCNRDRASTRKLNREYGRGGMFFYCTEPIWVRFFLALSPKIDKRSTFLDANLDAMATAPGRSPMSSRGCVLDFVENTSLFAMEFADQIRKTYMSPCIFHKAANASILGEAADTDSTARTPFYDKRNAASDSAHKRDASFANR